MGQGDAGIRTEVAAALAWVGWDPAVSGVRVLTVGLSGAAAYRVATPGGDMVLKVTPRSASEGVWGRAVREVAFYRDLAPRVGVRTPPLLAARVGAADRVGAAGAALLLGALSPWEPGPAGWTEEALVAVAGEAAALHAPFWGRIEDLAGLPWLGRPPARPDGAALAAAWVAWQGLGAQERLRGALPEATLGAVRGWLVAAARGVADDALPLTLLHGDLHAGNLLRDGDGRPAWADWQEVRLGQGPEDLSFFLQRAHPAGPPFPLAGIAAAYAERLTEATGEAVDPAAVQRAMEHSELRVRLFEWPAYLQGAPEEVVAGHVARVRRLAEGLLGG